MDCQSTLVMRNEDKVDTIVKLLESSTSQIMTWHNQAYVAATASLGLLLGITKLWLGTQQKTLIGLAVFEVGIIAFTVLAYLYLKSAQSNYNGNWKVKVKCEHALRLKDEGAYFETGRFFWAPEADDMGMPCRDIRILKYANIIIGLILAVACLLIYSNPMFRAGAN